MFRVPRLYQVAPLSTNLLTTSVAVLVPGLPRSF
jgi:hypothetical protein